MNSLRSRAIFGGSIWAALIVLVGGYALFTYFANATQTRFDQDLLDEHLQIVVALNNSGGDPDLINSYISNPNYSRPYSGSYWQAVGPDDIYLTSRSLFDTYLPDPVGIDEQRRLWEGPGPDDDLRGVQQLVTLDDGSQWIVLVGESLAALVAEQQRIRQSLLATLGLIGVLGVAAAVLLTSVIVRPLVTLREDVAHRWDEGNEMEPTDYPEEVAPLVRDINTLMTRNRDIVDRARRQAADMAHALKTPTAILRNELDILEMNGTEATQAQEALARIDAQIARSLARLRAANSSAAMNERVDLAQSAERLARVFNKMKRRTVVTLDIAQRLRLPMNPQDLEEILGNTLENAFKYGAENVRITGTRANGLLRFMIEDDGPGIPDAARREALRAGGRLDTAKPGTGLGLAIAMDLLQAYGGDLKLETSANLGGLAVICELPSNATAQRLAQAAE